MSTRYSISYGDFELPGGKKVNVHLYEEMADPDSAIFLEMRGDVEFSAVQNSVMLKIPMAVWQQIRKKTLSQYERVDGKSDEEILEMGKEAVRERLEDWAKRPTEKKTAFAAMMGVGVFGAIDDPEEEQVKNYVEYMKDVRDGGGKKVERND